MTRMACLWPRSAACAVLIGVAVAIAWNDPAAAQTSQTGPAISVPAPPAAALPMLFSEPEPEPGPEPGPGDDVPTPLGGQQLCAADLDGSGDASAPGETASCVATTSGQFLCPIEEMACVADAAGQYGCPAGPQFACLSRTGGRSPSCSRNPCADVSSNPIVVAPPIEDSGTEPDGLIDADGNCLGQVEIFGGRGMRCRPSGLGTTFASCCKDKGKIIKDGMGSSVNAIGTKIAVTKGVFQGMSAAYAAFRAGATASQAASAGANALVVGLDPTSIAISLAVNFMIEVLLQGCDQQDMETAMLKGSGMCHEVGSYCASSFLGICLQKARSHCCFNTKLGRIIQEQGRPQLKAFNGNLWGTPKKPMCRGFTPEEFQALDFSRMDLSAYYADIEVRAQSQIQVDMKERVDAYLKAIGE